MSQYFPKLHMYFGEMVKTELDLYNYATKSDVKKQQVMKHHHLQKDLTSLK